jgi:maltooligosyltrehalose trehalohydrolase
VTGILFSFFADKKRMSDRYPFAGAALQSDGSCLFRVWAPFVESVGLVALDTVHQMARTEDGYWAVTLNGLKAGDTYEYILDGQTKRPDPASRYQPSGVHGPSAIVSTDFNWTDTSWKSPSLSEMVIYELHVGTFSATHDFAGVIAKLDYLRSLGVNAIELMPVAQFPGDRNWGYDGVFPYAVQSSYGGVSGLKELINAAHEHGIAVILDVVYNHLGPEGNYLPSFGPYFTEKYKTPWGPAINFDDAMCDAVRAYYIQNALMWLNEFHIDGLRMDAVHAIWDCGATHFIEELTAVVGSGKILIAEIDYNAPRYITPHSDGGYGMTGQWIDEFHHAIHSALTGEVNGYYEDFGGIEPLAKSYRDSYVYTGQYSKVRKRNFGRLPVGRDYDQFVVFTQNHDQIGNRMLGERLSSLLPYEAMKLAAALLLLSPHVPMLYMGEEYGEKQPFLYFTSHSDKDLIEAVRTGRKEEFASFAWEGEVPDPQSDKTFEDSTLRWEMDASLLEYYRFLIALRKTRTALRNHERSNVSVSHTSSLLEVERSGGDDRVLLLFNISDKPITYTAVNALSKKFDSAADVWKGPGAAALDEASKDDQITLQPYSALVYEII